MKSQGTMLTVPHIDINIDTVYVRENIKDISTAEQPILWEYDETQYTLEEFKETIHYSRLEALKRIDGKCSQAIYAGIDIDNTHYYFTERAQSDWASAFLQVLDGAVSVSVKVNGVWLNYTAQQIRTVNTAMRNLIYTMRMYNQKLEEWIEREEDKVVLSSIDFGVKLPQDLMQELSVLLANANINISDYISMFS